MKFVASLAVSAILIAAAVILYYYADRNDTIESHFRDSVSIARQIQQLDANWSMETARVESDPLADFDSLAAFIPQMDRLRQELADTIRPIPDLPAELSNEISSYLSAVDAKEERIERFKTSYAVVRNSVRYLPLAATNLLRLTDQGTEQRLAEDISRLTQDINAYLVTPSEPEQQRLTNALTELRERSVTVRPQLSNALANFVAHGEVLVARKIATDQIFEEATGTDISQRTGRIVSDLEFHADFAADQRRFFELCFVGTLGAMVLLWGGLAFFRFVETPVSRRSGARAAASAEDGGSRPPEEEAYDADPPRIAGRGTRARADRVRAEEPYGLDEPGAAVRRARRPDEGAPVTPGPPAAAPSPAATVAPPPPAVPDAPAPAATGPASAVPARADAARPTLSAARPTPEARALHRIVAGFISGSLTGSVQQILTRLDHLQQSQDQLRTAAGASGAGLGASGLSLDEEIETSSAVLASVRRQVDDIDGLAQRLASFSRQRDEDISYELINIDSCVTDACDAVQAEQYATVTRTVGDVPDIFASRYDILLLIEYILENAVLSVQEVDGRTGQIKIDVTQRNDDILITVVDNGDGFEADQKSKIFEPFYTTRDDHLGIGLPSAVYLAGKYRGTVSANSLPGEGTVFRITLPAGITAESAI